VQTEQFRRRSVGAPAARSALLTILGEYVLPRSGAAWLETLVAALAELEYKPQAARQAVARSVAGGWLKSDRRGRRSRLELTPETARMLHSGAERIYAFGDPWTWDGRWLLVVLRVAEARRDVRHRIRTTLAWEGLGSLGGGVWVTPHVEREAALVELADLYAGTAELLSFRAGLGAIGDVGKLVRQAWDLDGVAASYRAFIDEFGSVRARTPREAFRAQTRLVHAWRRFPFLDPDLPGDVLPARWPRDRAHDLFADRHARWGPPAQDYFERLEQGGRPDDLPPRSMEPSVATRRSSRPGS
jgi:phenylacetic acid degradation operon negative regulatory protein